jgi:hypothetical protein
MSEDEPKRHDDGLSRLLRRWRAPVPPGGLDRRMFASYRAEFGRPPFWRAWLTTSVRVPLPVALLVVVIAVVSTALLVRRPPGGAAAPAPFVNEGAAMAVRTTDLTGFEPPTEVKVTILSQGE